MDAGLRDRHDRDAGPDWPIRPPSVATTPTDGSLRDLLLSRGAVSWYTGGGIALIWLISIAQEVVAASGSVASAVIGVVLVVLFGVSFLIAAPVSWSLPRRHRLIVCAGLLALSFSLFPWIGWGVFGTWTYVGVLVGMSVLRWAVTWPVILGLGATALVVSGMVDGWTEDILWLPAIIVSISLMMAAFARTTAAMNQLRATQSQLEILAVERERNRVGRDLHDILGHSLTVITVKAELAGRLVDVDPARARAEIGEVEGLARGALADVRATVAGFRGVNISGELAAARSALDAAGIDADTPASTDSIPAPHRELAGWVVREGVTNVVRHSHAQRCRITLSPREIEIADDGVGPTRAAGSSTGLAGLRERVEAAGARMSVGRSDLGGFSLRVTL
ncbi:sensor histidine kinase [Microbacterium rhizomatis]|uniref:Sensor histidine kinase n=1 Tax=Microbacterium rhizomatis TaxID=1631477 RepID=A0A5J5J1P3_9MICO|nr:sensor histidine kinase [Microbacterium rhizomatis]KAA9108466.1 sensor histidine kinase [Microbacterium rhizomatis]